MKYSKVPPDFFQKLVLNAGVFLTAFDPVTGDYRDSDILGATTGGLSFAANPQYIDFGADMDNVSPDAEQLKRVSYYAPSLSGTLVSADAASAKTLLGAADAGPAHIRPRDRLTDADFSDLWLVGDYSDKNKGPTAGYFAILLKNALNSDGLQLQSNKDGKGTLGFTFGGHYDFDNLDAAPFELYVQQSLLNMITITPPTKLSYDLGDSFNASGFTVTLRDDNGAVTNITSECSLLLPDGATLENGDFLLTASDSLTVSVTYHNAQIGAFDLAVSAAEIVAFGTWWTIYRGNTTGRTTNLLLVIHRDGNMPPKEWDQYIYSSNGYNIRAIRTVIIKDGATSVCANAFHDESAPLGNIISRVEIPDSVISIGEGAFEFCSNLTSVVIPDSVTKMGNFAFNGCSNLQSVTLSASLKSLGYHAFCNCTSLERIELPEGLESISDAFHGCHSLKSVTIPDSVTSMNGAFGYCASLTNVIIPDSVTSMSYAFSNCTSLTSVTIPRGVTTLYVTFSDCKNLTSVTILNDAAFIDWYAFSGCVSLTNFSIPDRATKIGEFAFNGCTGLTSVTIPKSVKNIGKCAFSGCTNLTSVTISRQCVVGDNAFPSGCVISYYEDEEAAP